MENSKRMSMRFLWAILIISGCAGPKTMPSAEPEPMPSAALEDGRIMFNSHCGHCHPGGMAGLGPAIINKPLPKFLMRFQIRNGLGVMPSFDEKILADQEVKNIASYLVHLRKRD